MVGTLWTDDNGNRFEITSIDHSLNGATVHYKKLSTGEKYDCLLEAFELRFTRTEKSR